MEYGSEPLLKPNNKYQKAYIQYKDDFHSMSYAYPFDNDNGCERIDLEAFESESLSMIGQIFQKECERLNKSNVYFYGCSFENYKDNYETRLNDFKERYIDVSEYDFIESELKIDIHYFITGVNERQINFSLKLRNEYLEQMKKVIQTDEDVFDLYYKIEDVTENQIISLITNQYVFLFKFYNQFIFCYKNPKLEHEQNLGGLKRILFSAYNYYTYPYTIPDEDLIKYFKNYCLTNKSKKNKKFFNLILFELESLIQENKKNEKNILNLIEIDNLEYTELNQYLFYIKSDTSSIRKNEVTSDDLYFVIIQKLENLKSNIKDIFNNIENENLINNSSLQISSEEIVLNDALKTNKAKDYKNYIWFKTGIPLATGEAFNLYGKYKNDKGFFLKICLELGFKEGDRPYFSETINGTTNNDKNTFANKDKLQKLHKHLTENSMNFGAEFLKKYNEIEPE